MFKKPATLKAKAEVMVVLNTQSRHVPFGVQTSVAISVPSYSHVTQTSTPLGMSSDTAYRVIFIND
jgi:hypothetical protein